MKPRPQGDARRVLESVINCYKLMFHSGVPFEEKCEERLLLHSRFHFGLSLEGFDACFRTHADIFRKRARGKHLVKLLFRRFSITLGSGGGWKKQLQHFWCSLRWVQE